MIERITPPPDDRVAAAPAPAGCCCRAATGSSRSAGFQTACNRSAQDLTMGAQRLVIDRSALAREFDAADMSPVFRTNGNVMPASAAYQAHAASAFADWRLVVDGLVTRPLALSLDRIRRLPARTQITRHDCVEGWSAIGKWTGVPLRLLLARRRAAAARRATSSSTAPTISTASPYYESIDLIDAFHPQTILA